MLIDGVTNADAIPVLERLMQFSGARHRVIVNNIANLDTPAFLPKDVDVDAFQKQLADAVDEKRKGKNDNKKTGSPRELNFKDSDEVEFTEQGIKLNPQPAGQNILFHDGNDRDLERTMQAMVENFSVFRTAAQLLRNRFDLINTAIRERV